MCCLQGGCGGLCGECGVSKGIQGLWGERGISNEVQGLWGECGISKGIQGLWGECSVAMGVQGHQDPEQRHRELHYIVGTKRSAARISSLERPPESLCNAGLILEDFLCLIDRSNPHSPLGAQKRHMCVASLALV